MNYRNNSINVKNALDYNKQAAKTPPKNQSEGSFLSTLKRPNPNNKIGTLDTLPNDYDYDVGSIIARNIKHKEGNFEISSDRKSVV